MVVAGAIFILIVVLDQLTKHWVLTSFALHQSQPVIPGFFDLTLVFNPGAAFGLFSTLPDTQRRTILFLVSLVALFVIVRLMLHDAKHDRVARLALVSILGGALGNMIDRLRFDAVVDFLLVYYQGFYWPAFNVADSAISIGVTVLALRILFPPHSPDPAADQTPSPSQLV